MDHTVRTSNWGNGFLLTIRTGIIIQAHAL
jgi:hypothetical protein